MHKSRGLMVVILGLIAAGSVQAQQKYPTKPIRFIVPYPPGGSTDYTAREIAPRLAELWGQQLVIDNRGGAGSLIGHGLAANAVPDGYTLLLGTSTGLSISPALGTKLAYDPRRDFAPIGLIVYAPYLLTLHASIAATSVQDVAWYQATISNGAGEALTNPIFLHVKAAPAIAVASSCGPTPSTTISSRAPPPLQLKCWRHWAIR